MKSAVLVYCFVNFLLSLLHITEANSDFVCYHGQNCAENDTRPVFVLGVSNEDCCGMPSVEAALEIASDTCTNCGPPTLRQLSPQFVVLSPPDSVVLEVEATGYTAISWLVNGTDMHDFERVSLENFSKRFVLVNTTLGDAGEYETDVHTVNGTVITAIFYLLPFREPTVAVSAVPRLDGSFLLSCTTTGFPPPTVEWIFPNGSVVPTVFSSNTSRSETVFSGTTLYAELGITSQFQGFTCLALTEYDGVIFAANATIFINEESPSVVNGSGPVVIVTEGLMAHLLCSVQGQPLPSVKWLFNEKEIIQDGITMTTTVLGDTVNSVLTIGAVSYVRHRGLYVCLAENSVGEDLTAIQLIVRSPPTVTVSPTEVVLHANQSTQAPVFVCMAVGNSIPQVHWESNGQPLSRVCSECNLEFGGKSCEMGEAGEIGEASEIGEALLAEGEASEEPIMMGDSLDIADLEDLDEVCLITTYTTSEDTAITELTILKVSYFSGSTEFTCVGENGVENLVQRPESATANLITLSSPYIVNGLEETTEVVVTDTVQLICSALSSSPWEVTWYRDSQVIPHDSDDGRVMIGGERNGSSRVANSSLSISGVGLSDGGSYMCRITDSGGSNTTATMLNVLVPANITRPPQATSASLNRTAEFTCGAKGLNQPTLTWMKVNNSFFQQTLRESEKYGIELLESNVTEGTLLSRLEIRSVSEEDFGLYICAVMNDVTSIPSALVGTIVQSATAELVQQRAPEFITRPGDKTETVNRTVQFQCRVTGIPRPRVFWYREGELLQSSNRVTIQHIEIGSDMILSLLNIMDTTPSDGGMYNCLAMNEAPGIAEAYFEFTVLYSPVITTPVQGSVLNTVFPTSPTATLICSSTGTPPANLNWYRHGVPIQCTNEERDPVIISDDVFPPPNTTLSDRCHSFSSVAYSELAIANPRPEDGGVFTCLAVNSVGETSSTLYLQVNVEPTAVVDSEAETISELESLSLNCLALSHPTPQVSWLKDNKLLKTEQLARVTVTVTHVAEYHVVSSLTVDRAEPGRDDGIYQCRIDNTQTFGVVYDSINITITEIDDCEFDGGPQCFNGGECRDELGGYSCHCTANFTDHNCSTPVVSPEMPVIVEEPQNVDSEFLETVTLVCEAQGNPDPLYTWYKDGILVRETTEPFLILTEVEPSDRGLYHCIATNGIGSTNQSRSGLLTIDGVYQYSAQFTCRQQYNYTELLEEMSVCVSGNTLVGGSAQIFSVTARPVPPQTDATEDEILVTVVANGTSSSRVFGELHNQVDILASKFNCTFTNLRRFDGCPEERVPLSVEYGVYVKWPESEIGADPVIINCPCGKLNATQYGSPQLSRVCGGSYTYGAQWKEVDAAQCKYTDNTYKLCSVTQLAEEEQAAELARTTENSAEFRALDFAIAGLIMINLAEGRIITNNLLFQSNFTRSYSNLLNTAPEAVRESQREFQAASNIINTLGVFGKRLTFENTSTNTSLEERNVQVLVEDIESEDLDFRHSFIPDLRESLMDVEVDPTLMPLEGAHISLPSELLGQLSSTHTTESLRVLNVVQNVVLFVTENSANNADEVVGNLVISASVFTGGGGKERDLLLVEDLPGNQAVIVQFYLTEAINDTCVDPKCVFWDDTNKSSIYGAWSEEGCSLLMVAGREITCRCNHLTHFGLLMDISPDGRDPTIGLSLQAITYVGSFVSIFLLLILLFTYISYSKLREKVPGKMLVNTCAALIGVYSSFLLAIHGETYRQGGAVEFCYVVSAVLQYFLLAYFLWTALEAFHICLKLVKVFGSDIRNYVTISSIIAWGVPLVIVGLSAGFGVKYDKFIVKREENVDNDVTCQTRNSIIMCRADEVVFYAGILAPFLLTYTFNLIIYFIIIGSLGRQTTKKTKEPALNKQMLKTEYKRLVIVAFFLAIMFGLAWIFAILVAIPNATLSVVSQYIFSFFIGFQGLLYFVMHVMRSPNARRFWISLFYRPCPQRMPNFLKTWTTTSPQHVATHTANKQGNVKSNPIYASQYNLLSSGGESAFTTLQRPSHDVPDLATSPSSYSLASQTLQIDFTLPTIVSDDEDSSIDLQDLADIINTKFSDPTAPGVAVSPPRVPTQSTRDASSVQGRHIALQSLKFPDEEEEEEREYRLHVETEGEVMVNVLDLAYDSVYVNQDKEGSKEEEH